MYCLVCCGGIYDISWLLWEVIEIYGWLLVIFFEVECGLGGRLSEWFWFVSLICWIGFIDRLLFLGVVMSDSRCWLLRLLGGCCRSEGWSVVFRGCFGLWFRGERCDFELCWVRMWLWFVNGGGFILLGFLVGGMRLWVWFFFRCLFFGIDFVIFFGM